MVGSDFGHGLVISAGSAQVFFAAQASLAAKVGFGSHVPSRAPETASSFWNPLFCRPIAEANAAPLMATDASTVRSRRSRGGHSLNSSQVLNQPSSGPPIWSAERT